MTVQEKEKLMAVLQDFVNDNLGQKITKWNGTSLLGTMAEEMGKMTEIRPNTAKENHAG